MNTQETFRQIADLNGLPSRQDMIAAGFSAYEAKAIERAPHNYAPEIAKVRAFLASK